MATETDIANEALVLLGASKITDIDSATQPNAVVVNTFFDSTRDALLRAHVWKFAIKRASITANVTAPAFGRARAFDLPADYLALLAPYPEDHMENLDWIVEGVQIVTDDSSPLQIRYIYQVTSTALMTVHFRKALAARLAVECAEKITQSATKREAVMQIYDAAIEEARKSNAFEQVNPLHPEDSWVTGRHRGMDNTKAWHG